MTKHRLFISVMLGILVWGSGCGEEKDRTGARLMRTEKGKELRGIRTAGKKPSQENRALRFKELESRHNERLAAIKAEKEKALRALELEKSRSADETRKRIREIEARNALQLAEEKLKYAALIAEKETTIKRLELNATRHRDLTQQAITRMQTQSRMEIEKVKGEYEKTVAELDKELKERYLIILAVVLLLLVGSYYFYRYFRKSDEHRNREEERRHEAWLLERRLRHEEIEKVLEIIASEKTDTHVKIELTRMLRQNTAGSTDPGLIEYRPDKASDTEEKGDGPLPEPPEETPRDPRA